LTKKEALKAVLNGKYIMCVDINTVIGYSDFGGGFYSINGADDGGDIYLEVHTIPVDSTFILMED